jgi:homoserine kinase
MADVKIPLKKGLSSSSSAIVAGLLIVNRVYDLKLGKDKLFNAGMEFESHADGIAASLYGGMVATYKENKVHKVKKISMGQDYRIVLLIPEFEIDTNMARKLIPGKVNIEDCIYNLSNALLLVESLKNNDLNMAKSFIRDKLHQPYRKVIYGKSFDLVNSLIDGYGMPAAISGAGPSVIAIINERNKSNLNKLLGDLKIIAPGYEYIETRICHKGSYIL